MSYAIVTKTHVDALITAARRWSNSTLVFQLPPHVANELDLTDDAADELGLVLLITNWNTAVLGGDPDEQGLDAEEVAWMEQEFIDDGFAKPVGYTLEELPGVPAPESALRLVESYRYQSNWEGEGLGAAAAFVDALEAAARQQLGQQASDLKELPRYRETPWLPGNDDRAMFVSGVLVASSFRPCGQLLRLGDSWRASLQPGSQGHVDAACRDDLRETHSGGPRDHLDALRRSSLAVEAGTRGQARLAPAQAGTERLVTSRQSGPGHVDRR